MAQSCTENADSPVLCHKRKWCKKFKNCGMIFRVIPRCGGDWKSWSPPILTTISVGKGCGGWMVWLFHSLYFYHTHPGANCTKFGLPNSIITDFHILGALKSHKCFLISEVNVNTKFEVNQPPKKLKMTFKKRPKSF